MIRIRGDYTYSNGLLFELFEHLLVAFMLSGVLWNVAAGYQFISHSMVPRGILLNRRVVDFGIHA